MEAIGIEVTLVPGEKGEFTVRVDGHVVAEKSGEDFPTPEHCVEQVKGAVQ